MNKKFKIFVYFILMSSLISYMVIKNDLTNIKKYQLDIRLFDDVLKTNLGINTDKINQNKPLPRKKLKIFCMVLTSAKNLESKAKIIYETWAHKCDNYKFISTVSDEIRKGNDTRYKVSENGTEFHYHFDILQPPGLINDTYSKLTDKVYITLKHLYNKYNDYDWYLKADDDTYIFVDNLRKFVSDKNPSSPVTYGYDFKVIVQNGYHSGGGGYLLSNEAFKRLGGMLNKDYKYCPNTGTEDVDIARCLRRLGVYPNKSIDDLGRERFHPLSISGHYNGEFPDWLYTYASNPVQKGLNCCSDSSISFHYMSLEETIKLHNILARFNADYQSLNKTNYVITFEDIIKKML